MKSEERETLVSVEQSSISGLSVVSVATHDGYITGLARRSREVVSAHPVMGGGRESHYGVGRYRGSEGLVILVGEEVVRGKAVVM